MTVIDPETPVDEKMLLTPESIHSENTGEVGGKAFNFSRLKSYGFSVPDSLVITTDVYDNFIDENNLDTDIRDITNHINENNIMESQAKEKIQQVQNKILSAELSDNLQRNIKKKLLESNLREKPLAIRSSANMEDSMQASFAGIHDSFLNVNGLQDIIISIKQCYASLWSTRAIAYRRKMKIADSDVKIAIVLMEMIDADISGVAFSCDPSTGREDQLLINANYGLGDAVVNGSVQPDSFWIDSFYLTKERSEIGKKEQQSRVNKNGGVSLEKNDSDLIHACLDDDQLFELSTVVLRIFQTLGMGEVHQDVEWSFAKGKLWILQTRPVTMKADYVCEAIQNQPEIWSNANLRDVVPMVLPFSVRFLFKRSLNFLMGSLYESIGYPIKPKLPFTRLSNGRVYFNLSLIQWLNYDAMSTLPAATNIYTGGHQPELELPDLKDASPSDKLRRAKYLLRYLRLTSRYRKSAEQIFSEYENAAAEMRKQDLHNMSDNELLALMLKFDEMMDKFGPLFILIKSSASSIVFLKQVLDIKFPGQGQTLANQLVSGSANITTANMGYELEALAELVKKDSQVLEYFKTQPFDAEKWQQNIPIDSAFYVAFNQFIQSYGHRGIYELDFRNVRWRENPAYLLNHIHKTLQNSRLTEIKNHQIENNTQAQLRIKQKFSRIFWPVINYLLKQSIQGAELNEEAKSVYVKLLEPYRIIGLEFGRRFLDRDKLESPEDIWQCTRNDIISICRNYWDGNKLKQIVEERKQLCTEQEKLPAPDLIVNEKLEFVAQKFNADGAVMQGIGVACGKESGKANKITSPDEGLFLEPGEILVAPSTDPAWTPLFLNATAIVMETGGYLSHGSIVAREYGIPAVVNVAGVMSHVNSGDTLLVNGDEGKIVRKNS